MLVELGVVEQGYRVVLEVLQEGAPVTEVARRYGVARQRVHEWLARFGRDSAMAICLLGWNTGEQCGKKHANWLAGTLQQGQQLVDGALS